MNYGDVYTMNYGNVWLLLSAGFVLGIVFGWWMRGARYDDRASLDEFAALLREHGFPPADPEAWARERLAYDLAYDAKHPEN